MSVSERTDIFSKYENAKNRIRELETAIKEHKLVIEREFGKTNQPHPNDLKLWQVLNDADK